MTGFISANYTCSHGITPSIATLRIPVQNLDAIAPIGDLTISDGVSSLFLRSARLSRFTVVREGGYSVVMAIEDCRWRWRFGSISGHYNERDDHGRVKERTAKHPRDLIRLLWRAIPKPPRKLAVRGLRVPNKPSAWPEVRWQSANPSRALASLADQFGMRVVYQPNADTLLITSLGVGARPINQDWTQRSFGATLTAGPDRITAVTEANYLTQAFALEAVGLDVDGKLRPLEDLTYRPANGWTTANPPEWPTVVRNIQREIAAGVINKDAKTDLAVRALARESVYRYYRIKLCSPMDGNKPLTVEGIGQVQHLDQILLENGIMDPTRKANTVSILPPQMYGSYYAGGTAGGRNTAQDEAILTPFSIDAARRLVVFDRLVGRVNTTTTVIPNINYAADAKDKIENTYVPAGSHRPSLPVMVVSARFRLPTTNDILTAFRTRKIRNGDMEQIITPQGLRRVVTRDYEIGTWKISAEFTNDEQFVAEADYHIAGILRQYEQPASENMTFPGLLPIDPDGLMHQISWSVGGGSPIATSVSISGEHSTVIDPYPIRRRTEIVKELVERREQDLRVDPIAVINLRGGL